MVTFWSKYTRGISNPFPQLLFVILLFVQTYHLWKDIGFQKVLPQLQSHLWHSALTQSVLDHSEPMGKSSHFSIIEFGTLCNFSYCFDFCYSVYIRFLSWKFVLTKKKIPFGIWPFFPLHWFQMLGINLRKILSTMEWVHMDIPDNQETLIRDKVTTCLSGVREDMFVAG